MPGEREGGVWALGGYLYQIVATLGIVARAENIMGNEADRNGDEFQGLLTLAGVSQSRELTAEAERFGEDAMLRKYGFNSRDQGVLVQFKFSRRIPLPTIGQEELKEILKTFEESVDRARRAGIRITACVLISNRSFAEGGEAEQLWQAVLNRLPFEIRSILDIHQDYWINQLDNFAKRYGAIDDEIERGVERLIGIVTRATGEHGNAVITRETLIECFTGSSQAHSITVDDLSNKCERELTDFGNNIRVDAWEFSPIHRDILRELEMAIDRRALIGLHGPGGCGKSVLLWHLFWLYKHTTVYRIGSAYDVTDNWIRRMVNLEWRYLPLEKCPGDTPEIAIKRLITANPAYTDRPILWLGIDGLDESTTLSDQLVNFKDLARWFWSYDQELQRTGARAETVLLITCRIEKQLRDILDIPYDRQDQFPQTIYVNRFNDEELGNVIKHHFPDRLSPDPIPLYTRSSSASVSFSNEVTSIDSLQIDKVVLRSLYHPATWRSLLNLDGPTQQGALDGKPEAMQALAKEILNWFDYKLNRRVSHLRLSGDDLIRVLTRIAVNTTETAPANNLDWINIAAQTCGEHLAHELLMEAELSGLIEFGSDTTWRWRYPFVFQYLVANQP